MKHLIFGNAPKDSKNWKRIEPEYRYNSYSKEEIEFVASNFLKYTDKELAEMFGRTQNGITALRSLHGLNRERRAPFKVTLRNAIREAQLMRELWCITQDMKALIIICQLNINSYKKEQYKKELLKLSNFNITKIKPLKFN